MTNTPVGKYRSRTEDELGVHILEELAAMVRGESSSVPSENVVDAFEAIGSNLQQIDNLLTLDRSQRKAMRASKGVVINIIPSKTRNVQWLVRAFRDPIRIAELTHGGSVPFAAAYVVEVAMALSDVRYSLEATAEGGGKADLACNRGLRQYHIKSLKRLSHDLDFELVYNVFASSNLSGDPSKPDWHELIDTSSPNKPKPPGGGGGGPNNGGTPKGALIPFPQLNTVAVAA